MITYISSWARQVIVSVVVAIILEMILSPDSKSTKYIKTVIGIYVVYAMIAPGLNLLGGKKLDFSNIDYENYFVNSEIYQNLDNNVDKIETNSFEETYKLKLKQDIENKLREKGFIVSNIKLETNLEKEGDDYGKIKEIEISLSSKGENKNHNDENVISINKVTIDSSNSVKKTENSLTEEDKKEIIEFLSKEYGIEKNNILIR